MVDTPDAPQQQLDGPPPPPPGFSVVPEPKIDGPPPPPPGFTLAPYQEIRNPDPGSVAARSPYSPVGGIVSDRDLASTNLGAARASLAVDVPTQIKRYAEQFGVPTSHFGVVNGDIVRWVPDRGVYAKVSPSVTDAPTFGEALKRIPGATAAEFGPAIPAAAGMAAGAATGPTGASIPLVGGLAAAADLARQALDKALAGESVVDPKSYSYGHAAGQGAEQALGQGIGLKLNKIVTGNVLNVPYSERAVVTPEKQAAWKALDDEAKSRGFTGDSALTPGQVSGLPSLMVQERQLRRDPNIMDSLFARRDAQREQATPKSFRDQLDQISPYGGRENQIGAFRRGADTVVDNYLTQRSADAKVAYNSAFADKPPFYSDALDDLMRRPSMKAAYKEAQKMAAEAPGEPRMAEIYRLPSSYRAPRYELGEGIDNSTAVVPPGSAAGATEPETLQFSKETVPDWLSWQRMKQGLDNIIEKNTDPITGKVNPDGRLYGNTKRELMRTLYKENPEWKAADLQYGHATDAVDTVLNGGIGLVHDLAGPERQAVVNRIFSSSSLLPEEVGRMRQLFDANGMGDSWNAGLRAFMEGKLSTALTTNTQGQVGNVPGILHKQLWGNPDQRAVLEAAIGDKGQVADMGKLMQVYEAAAKSLPEGSPTATDLAAGKGRVTAGEVFAKALSPGTLLDAGNTIYDIGRRLRDPAQRAKLANYMLSPEAKNDLSKLRLLSPTSQKAIVIGGQIATNAGLSELSQDTGIGQPRDFAPPATPAVRFNKAPKQSSILKVLSSGEPPLPSPGTGFAYGGRVNEKRVNKSPSEAQKEAGNYAKEHVRHLGLDMSIENVKGYHREGVGPDGKPWKVKMPAHYGYIKGTVGADKDHVDVYLGPHHKSKRIFVIDQHDAGTGKFDEHKAFVGFANKHFVTKTFHSAFSDGKGPQRLGAMREMTVEHFKDWLTGASKSGPLAKK